MGKRLTIEKFLYGSYERLCYGLDYHDGGAVHTEEAYGGLSQEFIDRIGYALNNGYIVDFEDHTKKEEV